MSEFKGASPTLSYRQKHEQANREAVATVVALAVTVVAWIALGFGLAGLDVQVFHTPLWVVGGTIGTWVCAIIVSVVLARSVFADFPLDDGEAGTLSPAEHAPMEEGGDHE